MRDESRFIHDFHDVTTIDELGLVILVVLVITMFFVNRRSVIVPILIMACFMAPAQRIVVFGLDFNLIRILVLFGWVRLFLKNEYDGFVWKPIDKILLAWGISSAIAYVLLRDGASGALIFKLGNLFDSIGLYFLFRILIKEIDDLKHIIVSLAILSIPVAILFITEKNTGRNFFAIFGGLPEFTPERYGKLRAQGAYPHAIIAGCFWVTQLPLFLSLWWQDVNRRFVFVSSIAVILIVYSCASSTPVAGLVAVLIGYGLFLFREHLQFVRWSVVFGLIFLHIVMNAPVWHLISRIDLVGGSTGWHRYHLIDQTIHRFSEWWLFGTHSTAHWGWYLFDTTNMYVNEAVRGGFVTLCLFFLLIYLAFRGVGSILDSSRNCKKNYLLAWALGVSLFTHCTVFIAVSYFGQIIVVWYLLLAAIGSLTPHKVSEKVDCQTVNHVKPFQVQS